MVVIPMLPILSIPRCSLLSFSSPVSNTLPESPPPQPDSQLVGNPLPLEDSEDFKNKV